MIQPEALAASGFLLSELWVFSMSALFDREKAGLVWRVMAALSLLWALFVLWGCLNESGSSGGLILRLFPFLHDLGHTDKLVHAGLHAVLASLLWWPGMARMAAQPRAKALSWSACHALFVVLLCAAYGGLIELLQAALTSTRGAEWLDALAKTLGASVAVLFWQGVRSWFLQKRELLAHGAT